MSAPWRGAVVICLVWAQLGIGSQIGAARTNSGSDTTKTGVQAAVATTTVYLPNITRMLGGRDGWQTPFIVQNVGAVSTDLTMSFYAFSDGSLVKTRTVAGLPPGNSVFHDPNSDTELPAEGQFGVVVQSFGSPIVAVVNEHQNLQNAARQEALSYQGLSQGSTKLYAPYFAYNVSGWVTTLIVQNLGLIPTVVSLQFTTADGTRNITLTRALQPGRSDFVDPRVEPTLLAGFEYTITMTASQPIGAVINAHNDAATVAQPRGFSYNASRPSDIQESFLPYVAKNTDGIGRSTRLFVQNTSTVAGTAHLAFCQLGNPSCVLQTISAPSAIPPGGVWSLDLAQSPQLADGEYSIYSYNLTGEANYLAILAATTSPATALGYTSLGFGETKWFLPNVTRTLGGPAGWTTPIVIQSTGSTVTTANLSWYRFADGALVYQQTLLGLQAGSAVRVDPRTVPALADNTQYAVVVTAPTGGVAVVVTELNFLGGDSAMAYEGFSPPEAGGFGNTSCAPTSAPAGTTFKCRFYGLPPGATPVTFTLSNPSGTPTTSTSAFPVASDGSATYLVTLTNQGTRTVTASAGGLTLSASATVLPATFSVSTTQSRNGFISVQTKASIPCSMYAVQPNGNFGPAFVRNIMTSMSDGTGLVSFPYTPVTTPSGTWLNVVRCNSGSETLAVSSQFTVP